MMPRDYEHSVANSRVNLVLAANGSADSAARVQEIGVVPSEGSDSGASLAISGLGSGSWCSETSSDLQGVSLISDPVTLLKGVLECNVDPTVAAQMVMSYYATLQGQQQERITSVTSQGSVASTMSTGRQLRLAAWNRRIREVSALPGNCHLSVVKWSRRVRFYEKLGLNPKLSDFVAALEQGDLLVEEAKRFSLFKLSRDGVSPLAPDTFHIAEVFDNGERVCSVAAMIECIIREFPWVNKGYHVPGLPREIETMPIVGYVGSAIVIPSMPEPVRLRELLNQDVTQCKCSLHVVPLTKDRIGSGVITRQELHSEEGCFGSVGGLHPLFANAFNGVETMCGADESVRRNDVKFLRYVLGREDPKILVGRRRPKSFQRLCTSRINCLTDFGNGYCYMALLCDDVRFRVARILGPNPMCADVMWILRWGGRASGPLMKFQQVKPGWYHVEIDDAQADDSGMRSLYNLWVITQGDPNARIGSIDDTVAHLSTEQWLPLLGILVACCSMLVTITALMIRMWCLERY